MKKRTTITTEKREIWIISEGDPQSHIPKPGTSTNPAEVTDTALVKTEQVPMTTNNLEDAEK